MEGPGGGARMFTGVVRRLYEVHFRKEYVRRQLERRRGECRQCGTCCRFLFRCPLLTPAGRCLVYGKARPLACKLFPIDGKDIADVAAKGGACGYGFGQSGEEASGRKSKRDSAGTRP